MTTERAPTWPLLLTTSGGIVAYFVFRLQLRPDYSLYVGHGLGLFPSPAGRLLGALGLLVAANAAAAGVLVAWLWCSGVAWWRLLVAAPVLVWLLPAGVDALGALAALYALTARRSSGVAGGAALALLVHPVAAVAPAVELLRRRPWIGFLLLVGALALVSLTPYRAVLTPTSSAPAAVVGLALVAVCLASFPTWGRHELVLSLAVGVAGYLVRSSDHGTGIAYLRYALPVVLLGALSRPRFAGFSPRSLCGLCKGEQEGFAPCRRSPGRGEPRSGEGTESPYRGDRIGRSAA